MRKYQVLVILLSWGFIRHIMLIIHRGWCQWILSFIRVKHASVFLNAIFKPRLPFILTSILLNLLTVGICPVHSFQSIVFQFFYVTVFSNFRWQYFLSQCIWKCLFWKGALNPLNCGYYFCHPILWLLFSLHLIVSLRISTLSWRTHSNTVCIYYTGGILTMYTVNEHRHPSPARWGLQHKPTFVLPLSACQWPFLYKTLY